MTIISLQVHLQPLSDILRLILTYVSHIYAQRAYLNVNEPSMRAYQDSIWSYIHVYACFYLLIKINGFTFVINAGHFSFPNSREHSYK